MRCIWRKFVRDRQHIYRCGLCAAQVSTQIFSPDTMHATHRLVRFPTNFKDIFVECLVHLEGGRWRHASSVMCQLATRDALDGHQRLTRWVQRSSRGIHVTDISVPCSTIAHSTVLVLMYSKNTTTMHIFVTKIIKWFLKETQNSTQKFINLDSALYYRMNNRQQ